MMGLCVAQNQRSQISNSTSIPTVARPRKANKPLAKYLGGVLVNLSAEVTKKAIGIPMARIPNDILATCGLYHRNISTTHSR